MTTEEALLRLILDAPGADAPKLVFADWLDERGEEARAELVRLLVRLALLPEFAGVTLLAGAKLRRCVLGAATRLAPAPAAATVTGLVPAGELPAPSPPPPIGQLRSDQAFALRWAGVEAPRAAPDWQTVRPRDGGLLRVRFTLFPVQDGARVLYFRPYSDPHEAERQALRRRERELRAALKIPWGLRGADVFRCLAVTPPPSA
jgi:uncharacterized protein (TIGR02996 family)